ncbi:putative HTLV-1-related endogenous sequence [Artibeus jamaicensis]|uniref:putative HTLV-1-related endogenous sequence n=1 Tax=Artibeus jamaicensis TaxID=9417 RepID=UPI00235A4D04|nr:putative HTLV-1-related endogenous sequence [Artibeus jamaicensis]
MGKATEIPGKQRKAEHRGSRVPAPPTESEGPAHSSQVSDIELPANETRYELESEHSELPPRGGPSPRDNSPPRGSPDTTLRGPSARSTRTSETRSAGTGYSLRARGDYRGRSLAARRPALPIGSDSARTGLQAKEAGPAGYAGAVGLRSGGRPAAEGARRSSSSAAAVRVLLELRRLFPGSGSAAPAPDAAARGPEAPPPARAATSHWPPPAGPLGPAPRLGAGSVRPGGSRARCAARALFPGPGARERRQP